MNDKKAPYIGWIDGLKGIACLLIFVYHFILAYFPMTYYGDVVPWHYAWETKLYSNPMMFLVNGNFWVCIFCLVSGFLVSYIVFVKGLESVSKMIVKRYLRLSLPVFFISFLVYLMMQADVFTNVAATQITQSPWYGLFYTDKVTLKDVFETSFFCDWFLGSTIFSNAFWMLRDLFIGWFLSFILSLIALGDKAVNGKKDSDTNSKKEQFNYRIMLVYILVALVYFRLDSLQLCFVIGTMVAYIFATVGEVKLPFWVTVPLMLIGLYLAGYPSEYEPVGIYENVEIGLNGIRDYQVFHILAAFFVFLSVLYGKYGKKILGNKVLCYFGKLSFGIYLLHIPVLFSVTGAIFINMYHATEKYLLSAGVSFVISLVVLLLAAMVYHHVIEKYIEKFIQAILKWMRL